MAGVLIEAAGPDAALHKFVTGLSSQAPPASHIEDLVCTTLSADFDRELSDFSIQVSTDTGTRTTFVPPDMDVCGQCRQELFDPTDRRYRYPFINCTHCGPRYTLMNDLPYDRAKTSMKRFSLCPDCAQEYTAPDNRRFHAQPNACPTCGPQLELLDRNGTHYHDDSPLETTIKLLAAGHIVAIKGIGGFHLAVDAGNHSAIEMLRNRKGRPDKPLAVMAENVAAIKRYALCSPAEQETLCSRQKPIVLLEKRVPFPLPASIAPNNRYIGAMLPYTPIHHLLFREAPFDTLVMTSANLSEEPIITHTRQALAKLAHVADYFLTHNREILTSNDDSVVYQGAQSPVFLRRSRSYAPAPITLDHDCGNTLAVGAALKNTLCVSKGRQYFLSQHIGDLQHLESIEHFNSVARHLQRLLLAEPDLMVHDLHPDYYSTRFALSSGLPTIGIQHHHAHAVSCMAENNLSTPVIAVIMDGTGYGSDGTIWGGEILTASFTGFERNAHFEAVPLPGGDAAVREPWRMALSYLRHTYGDHLPDIALPFINPRQDKAAIINQMIDKGLNSPLTSSCGRLFDAVSALIGLRHHVSFEGQAAIDLEMIADTSPHPAYSFSLTAPLPNNSFTLSFSETITEILYDLSRGIPLPQISRRFHETIALAIAHACRQVREDNGLHDIVLSGGSFQNRTLLSCLKHCLVQFGFTVHTHHLVPANDGGLCLGQAVAGRATQRLNTKEPTAN